MQRHPDISGISASDRSFFQNFYERNLKLMFFFAKRYTTNESDCEDLVHDTVLRLMKRIPILRSIDDSPGKVAYYICSTLQSAFIDRYRQESKIKQTSYPDDILESLIEERLYSQRTSFDSAYWDVRLIKEKLPKRDWSLLEGKYIIGYSDEELGKIHGCSKDSIRMALSRARKKAKTLIFESDSERGESDEQ